MEEKKQKNKLGESEILPIIVSNSYIKKYYLDERLEVLPKEIKNKIKKSLVELTEEVGGIVIVYYNNSKYDITFEISSNDDDLNFDEINAKYKLSRLEKEHEELFSQIANFCKFKFNGLV